MSDPFVLALIGSIIGVVAAHLISLAVIFMLPPTALRERRLALALLFGALVLSFGTLALLAWRIG